MISLEFQDLGKRCFLLLYQSPPILGLILAQWGLDADLVMYKCVLNEHPGSWFIFTAEGSRPALNGSKQGRSHSTHGSLLLKMKESRPKETLHFLECGIQVSRTAENSQKRRHFTRKFKLRDMKNTRTLPSLPQTLYYFFKEITCFQDS